MTEPGDELLEARLRAMLAARADRVDPDRVEQRIDVDAVRCGGSSGAVVVPITLTATGEAAAVRRHRLLASSLAAAAVLIAALVGTLLVHVSHRAPTRPTAAAHKGAAAVLYVRETARTGHQRANVVREVWIPADRSAVWLLRQPDLSPSTFRARCGAFFVARDTVIESILAKGRATLHDSGTRPRGARSVVLAPPADRTRCAHGGWTDYSTAFAAALPASPAAVLASMRRGSGDAGNDASVFYTGWDFVSDGSVQSTAVRRVVAAMQLLPQVRTFPVAGGGVRLIFTGRIKPTVPEHWEITIDAAGRVVSTAFSYRGKNGWRPAEVDRLTYASVAALGDTR